VHDDWWGEGQLAFTLSRIPFNSHQSGRLLPFKTCKPMLVPIAQQAVAFVCLINFNRFVGIGRQAWPSSTFDSSSTPQVCELGFNADWPSGWALSTTRLVISTFFFERVPAGVNHDRTVRTRDRCNRNMFFVAVIEVARRKIASGNIPSACE